MRVKAAVHDTASGRELVTFTGHKTPLRALVVAAEPGG